MSTVFIVEKLRYLYRNNSLSLMHKREKGISYYLPIINAWLDSDLTMKKYSDNFRGVLDGGEVLAKIYLGDMIVEHFESFKSKKEIEETIKGYEFLIIENKQYLNYKSHTQKFILKAWFRGIIKKYFMYLRDVNYW